MGIRCAYILIEDRLTFTIATTGIKSILAIFTSSWWGTCSISAISCRFISKDYFIIWFSLIACPTFNCPTATYSWKLRTYIRMFQYFKQLFLLLNGGICNIYFSNCPCYTKNTLLHLGPLKKISWNRDPELKKNQSRIKL